MKSFVEIINLLRDVVDGRECRFDDKDKSYLRQFGIMVLTGMRSVDGLPIEEETELDRRKREVGHIGCNDSCIDDFVCEKDGLMFSIFVQYGQWWLADDVLWDGMLLCPDRHENPLCDEPVGYNPMDLHEFKLYGTGYCLSL